MFIYCCKTDSIRFKPGDSEMTAAVAVIRRRVTRTLAPLLSSTFRHVGVAYPL